MCGICDGTIDVTTAVLVDCSNCSNIKSLPVEMPMVKFLRIDGTQITSIPSYSKLEGLYMMNCSVRSLPDFPKLKKLNARNARVTSIPDTLYQLEFLDVSNTKVSTVPSSLISLIVLKMSGCKSLTDVSSKLINLESLIVDGTGLTKVNSLMSLTYINISDTSVTELVGLPSLRKVVAKNCSIGDPFSLIELGIDVTM